MTGIETIVREHLCSTLRHSMEEAASLDLDEDLVFGYGLVSLDLIMLMTSICAAANISLTNLDEDDLSRLRTPADIVRLLTTKTYA